MIGYRSIGQSELSLIVNACNPVYGLTKWNLIKGSGCPELPFGTVCFFAEPYQWHDNQHKYDIVVSLDKYDVYHGVATYWAAANFAKTRVFTGRTGSTTLNVEELYTRFYCPEDIVSINLHNYFSNWYIEDVIKPFCEKYNIQLIR